ncbi:unnamed protein product [Schistosoma curassoni]|uniref:Uncharacterized protein n=1 Tax=Schistosoma curassoni TaxID=6186 RepID=A0A183JJK7_9TREM|nr:unnamed protein product [Schistosoma curassoni]
MYLHLRVYVHSGTRTQYVRFKRHYPSVLLIRVVYLQ